MDLGSSQVWQNVARFWRALPSSMSSSVIAWNTSVGRISSLGNASTAAGPSVSWSA